MPDYGGIARVADMQKEVDQRVEWAARTVIPKLLILGTMTVLDALAERRIKALHKKRRATAKALKPQPRFLLDRRRPEFGHSPEAHSATATATAAADYPRRQ